MGFLFKPAPHSLCRSLFAGRDDRVKRHWEYYSPTLPCGLHDAVVGLHPGRAHLLVPGFVGPRRAEVDYGTQVAISDGAHRAAFNAQGSQDHLFARWSNTVDVAPTLPSQAKLGSTLGRFGSSGLLHG